MVVLDECSQMTEPVASLPMRFGCEYLVWKLVCREPCMPEINANACLSFIPGQVLVGDPKQLPPTIGGSEATHERGLEYTLFERLADGGREPVMLRTQYRCHPLISRIPCDLFYGGRLHNGVSENDRSPLIDDLPTICFYDVYNGSEKKAGSGSMYNVEEARFVVRVLNRCAIASACRAPSLSLIACPSVPGFWRLGSKHLTLGL